MSQKTKDQRFALIEKSALNYSKKKAKLTNTCADLNTAINKVRDRFLPRIRTQALAARASQTQLEDLVEFHFDLFNKPKTKIFHGVKVGYRKQKGKTTIANPEKTIKLINKHHSDKVDLLIKTTETIIKGVLEKLSANELKRLGVTVTDSTDVVIVDDLGGEIEKIVKALLEADQKTALKES